MAGFVTMRYQEVHGHWPLMKPKSVAQTDAISQRSESEGSAAVVASKAVATEKAVEIDA
jgi:hypothetical protein